MIHNAVLQKEILEYLDPKPNDNFIDATVGEGGHTALILERIAPMGKVLAIDIDPQQINNCGRNIKSERLVLVNDSYVHLREIAKSYNFAPIAGILMDLGISSWHLETEGRGFSFQKDEPLDMRFNPKSDDFTAGEILKMYREEQIETMLREYGEERFSKKIAKSICDYKKRRPINTTFQLIEAVGNGMPQRFKHGKIHFATRTFQALRIEVNKELENIKKGLEASIDILPKGGKLAVISFHSLEDRIVKFYFKELAKENKIKLLTKKPVAPKFSEIKENRRSRSAKLRVAEKI